MGNFEQALKEMNEEWINSLPNPDDLPEIKLSEKYKKWEQETIYVNGNNRINQDKTAEAKKHPTKS